MTYHWTQKTLHWAVFVLLLAQIPVGYLIAGYDPKVVAQVDEALGKGAFNDIYDLHKSVGLTILGLMILRAVARAVHRAPPYAAPLTPFERAASLVVHFALYALLIVTPIIGWLGVSAYPAPVPLFFLFDAALPVAADRAWSEWLLKDVHGPLANLILVLALVHIAAAFKHRLVNRDEVFSRMTR